MKSPTVDVARFHVSHYFAFPRPFQTVNTASRMESNSKAGRIQCSDASAEILRKSGGCNDLQLVSRGELDIKGKGLMETFFVGGLDDELEEPATTAPSSPEPSQEAKDEPPPERDAPSRGVPGRTPSGMGLFGGFRKNRGLDSGPSSLELTTGEATTKQQQSQAEEAPTKKQNMRLFGRFRKNTKNRRASMDAAATTKTEVPRTRNRRASLDSAVTNHKRPSESKAPAKEPSADLKSPEPSIPQTFMNLNMDARPETNITRTIASAKTTSRAAPKPVKTSSKSKGKANGGSSRSVNSASGQRPKITNSFLAKAIDLLEASKSSGPEAIKGVNEVYEIVKITEESRKEFERGKGVPLFFDILKRHEGDMMVVEPALRLMAVLAKTEVNRDGFVQLGMIAFLLKVLEKNPENVPVQRYGCDAVSGLAETPSYQEMIVAERGIEIVMAAQKANVAEGDVQVSCFRALRCLATNNGDNASTIAAAGGIHAVMEILQSKTFPLQIVIELHVETFKAMAEFARLNESNRGSIALAGGIPKLIGGMSCFSRSSDLVRAGIDALYCLSIDHMQNCDTIVAYDGINIVMGFMKKHATHSGIQECGFLLMTELVRNSATAMFRLPSGCSEFVEGAMQKNSDNERLQELGQTLVSELNG